MDDAKIITLLRNQQADKAFTKLYTYYSKVEKHILSNSGTKPDAQDIYQEALIVLYNKCQHNDFELTSSLNTYIYGISKYLWSNQLRKKSGKADFDITDAQVTATSNDFDDIVEEQSKLQLAEKVLTQIGQKCLSLLTMFYYQSMSMKDIASKTGHSTEQSAKNAKYKCLQRAKARLQKLKQSETAHA